MEYPRILVIRGFDGFSRVLREAGFDVLNLELIKTEVLDDLRAFEKVVSGIGQYDGIFFTSPVAARVFVDEIGRDGKCVNCKIYALGSRTRRLFEDSGIDAIGSSAANTAEELIGLFDAGEFAGKKLLFVRGDKSLRTIPELLEGKAAVDEVVVYETVPSSPDAGTTANIAERLRSGEIGWICFFSPSGIDAFADVFAIESLLKAKIATIGPTTAGKTEELGIRVDFVSPSAGSEYFARGLINHIKENIE